MARFDISKILAHEGGYTNHRSDRGGETFAGIARNFHPHWAGWAIIDRYKRAARSTKELDQMLWGNADLVDMIYTFYKTLYWDAFRGDAIGSQLLAENILDFAVHSGVRRAVRFLQRILGVEVDGWLGEQTLRAINASDPHMLTALYIDKREEYLARLGSQKQYAPFLRGWMHRIAALKAEMQDA